MSDLGLLTVGMLVAGKTSATLTQQKVIQFQPVRVFITNSPPKSEVPLAVRVPAIAAVESVSTPDFSTSKSSTSDNISWDTSAASPNPDLSPQPSKREKIKAVSVELQDNEVEQKDIISPNNNEEISDDTPMSQITSVDQLTDVSPIHWSYGALRSLVERYGGISGYPDSTFRGDRPLTRYEFAAALNTILNKISQQKFEISQEDLLTLQRLQKDYLVELAKLRGRVDGVEARTRDLELQQFSPTTRLFGQAIIGLQGTNKVKVDLFPRDGKPDEVGQARLNLAGNVQLTLATSFTGRDLLLTGLQVGNLASSSPAVFTNMGRLSNELDTNNKLILSDLSYRFPLASNFGIVVGPAGVNPVNTFRGINPLEGAGNGSISLLGQRNPILTIGNSTGGIGFDWQINRRVSLQGVYSAEIPNLAGDSSAGGLFGGRTTAGAQLAIAPTDNIDLGLHYIYSHSPNGLLGTGIGDAQLVSPFAQLTPPFPERIPFNTHAIGATAAWRLNPRLTLGAWGGWTFSKPGNLSGSVETTNWMLFSAFPDLFGRGNLGGILFGQPPKITSSTLPEGFNFPNFSDGGTKGGRRDTSLHLEAFYRARVSDRISLTPGVLAIFNPDHNAANNTLLVGTIRATLEF